MSKSKSKGAKDVVSAPSLLNKVKEAAVTKPVQNAKNVSKELAQKVAGKEEKKSKKKAKEPTPEPSESEESEEEDDDDDSEDESEDEEEVKSKKPVNGKVNGFAGAKKDESEDDEESDSSDSSDDEAPTNGATIKPLAVNGAHAKKDESDDDESDESEGDEETVAEKVTVKSAKPSKTASKKVEEELSDKEDDESEDSEEDSESSEEEDSEEKVESQPAQPVKRKAQEDTTPAYKKTKTEATGETGGTNLFVGSLSWNVDEAWLTQEFESFGELAGVRVITDRDTGRSKGFGYVEFSNAADAAKAHTEMQGHEIDGRTINVDFAANKPSGGKPDRSQARAKSFGDVTSPPSDTLFVGNLAFDVGQDTVSQAFDEHGTILGVRLPTDRETGEPKGFGYVTFSTVEEATAALEGMQGAEISGRSIRLDYSQPRPQNGDSPGRGRGGFGGRGRGRGGFGDRGGRGGFGDRGGRGGRGRGGFGGFGGFSDRGGRGGRGGSTNRGGFGDYQGKKTTF